MFAVPMAFEDAYRGVRIRATGVKTRPAQTAGFPMKPIWVSRHRAVPWTRARRVNVEAAQEADFVIDDQKLAMVATIDRQGVPGRPPSASVEVDSHCPEAPGVAPGK